MKRALILIQLAMIACSHAPVDDTTAPEAIEPAKDAIVKTTENGPVKVTVRVWPAKPTLSAPSSRRPTFILDDRVATIFDR